MINFYIYLIFTICFLIIPTVLSIREILKNNAARRVLVNSAEYSDLTRKSFPLDFSMSYNFFGKFEGFENDNIIWLNSNDLTLKVRLKHTKVFYVPSLKYDDEKRSKFLFTKVDIEYKPLRWSSLSFLTSGTKFLLCGGFYEDNGIINFDGSDKHNIVLIYDGKDDDIKRRALSQIREKFVYFRGFPLMSIVFGILLILSALVFAQGNLELIRRILLTAASPMLLFLPPGFFLFYLVYLIKSKQKKAYAKINLALYENSISQEAYKKSSLKMLFSELLVLFIFIVIIFINGTLVKLFLDTFI